MGIEALTHRDEGTIALPESNEDWGEWVSATGTRNYVLGDPLLDWLDLYGSDFGFQHDDQLPGYDPRTDFSRFIMSKGNEFEAAVLKYLATVVSVHVVADERRGSRDLGSAQRTFAAMARGEELVYQAVLRDAETSTYGTADLLVRSDVLRDLFPAAISEEAASVPAPGFGTKPWHYRAVDIKFTTLSLLADGALGDSGSAWGYKLQVYVYNRALGRLQGLLPPEGYLLGRGWERKSKGETFRSTSCMNMLAAVPQDYVSKSKGSVAQAVNAACAWVRRVRTEGGSWVVLPKPTVPEMRPNMGNGSDYPWHGAKTRIAAELAEPTMLWQVGVGGRESAMEAGVDRWSDPAFTAAVAGVTGGTNAPKLDAILDVNRSIDGPTVWPSKVSSGEAEWRGEPPLEFYVDFETVSDLDDDFASLPKKGGQPLIFMIGCGHLQNGDWHWSCFTADAMTERDEAHIIDTWYAHMDEVRQRLDPLGKPPNVFHWSHAEASTLETAFTSAIQRHPDKNWTSLRWYDLLSRVVKKEPLVVRGALGFGLKAVAKALYGHGLIETNWEAGPADGLGAMVGAWSCAKAAANLGCTMGETDLMQEIARYNHVDCRVMMEILRHLRKHH